MTYKKVNNYFILRINKGEEVIEKITELCEKENIVSGTIIGLGATDYVEMGLFDTINKKYISNIYQDLFEITSLNGNISQMNSKPYLHIHISIADKENKTYGGHLNKCIISATCEIYIKSLDTEVGRIFDEEIGLNLIDIN